MGVDAARRRALALAGWATAVAATGAGRLLRGPSAAPATAAPPPSTGAAPAPPGAAGSMPQAGAAPAGVTPGAPAGAAPVAAAPIPVPTPLLGVDRPDGPPPPLEGEALVLHAARRAAFGPTPALLDELRSRGVDAWLEQQLRPGDVDDAELDAELARLPALGWSPARLRADGRTGAANVRELRLAAVLRAARSRRQLLEGVVDLWHDHLCTSIARTPVTMFVTADDRDAIRPHALGRFADLLTAVSLGPAMLTYLDTTTSVAPDVNENHGRELLELHTVGVEGGYTEDDVRAAARVLSGWFVDGDDLQVRFNPSAHDPGPATVLDWSTPGHAGPQGADDARSLLVHLAHHPATARRVAARLVQRFVSDDPPASLVESTAAAYLAAGTDLAATLRHVLADPWFRGGGDPIVRRPLDAVAALLRATGAAIDVQGDASLLGRDAPAAAAALQTSMQRLGQPLFEAPSPAGWPVAGRSWLSADALHRRWSLAGDLAHDRLPGIAVDAAALAGGATTAGAAVDALAARVLGTTPSPATRTAIVAFLAEGSGDDDAAYDPALLRPALALLLASPEVQHR